MKSLFLLTFALFSFVSFSQTPQAIISEFMAINDSVIVDEDGDYSDWIEIYNPTSSTLSLNGWYLTDNSSNTTKWKFPNVSINAGEYLLVFASEKNRKPTTGQLHTNFKLSGSGEFLALVQADGKTFASSFADAYPAQQSNVSYGLINGQYTYLDHATPGMANTLGDNVLLPIFSHKRGFYTSAFNVSISTISSNYDIYYTVDGTRPTASSGTIYTSAVPISTTTVLSAVAIDKVSLKSSAVVTQTYLFVSSVINQSNAPVGYPSVWGSSTPADYEMDPEICTEANKAKITKALKSLPTISLVTNTSNLFSSTNDAATGGIYMFTEQTADAWERLISIEYFDSTQSQSFQLNCGLRIHGGNSRKPGNSPKHSFRVSFRSDYGPTKLNFNLFDEKDAVNQFNSLVLRAGYNYSWVKNSPDQCVGTDYIRDPFTKKTQLDMDRESGHNKFVHVYINGLYWGVYNLTEKINNNYAEDYMGGNEDDYDVIKDHSEIADGNRQAWDSLLNATTKGFQTNELYQKVQGKNPDGSVNASYLNLLDVKNLTDYMIINFYIGNWDWDKNNWTAVRNRVTNESGFKFFCWDAESSMDDLSKNLLSTNNTGNPSAILTKLRENEEFKLFFADRVRKHFFNDGALTATQATARYMNIANTIESGLLGESARWGDYRRDVAPGSSTYGLYTVDNQWKQRVDYMQYTYLPQRSDIVLQQFKDAGLYPSIDAPDFSPFGGTYTNVVHLQITAADTVYYTLDDSDPRAIGGALASKNVFRYVNSIELTNNVSVKARAKRGSLWSALTHTKFEINIPPTAPVLCSPSNGQSLDTDKPQTFIWHKSKYADTASYVLAITTNGVSKTFEAQKDSFYLIPANTFVQNKLYTWNVIVKQGTVEVASTSNSFATNNIVPGAFSITSPATSTQLDVSKELVCIWSKSADEDNISYSLSVSHNDTTAVYVTSDLKYSIPANTLRYETQYQFQVTASDGKADTKTQSIACKSSSKPIVETKPVADSSKTDTITGINLLSENRTAIYPNPTSNFVNLQLRLDNVSTLKLELKDIAGRVLQNCKLDNVLGRQNVSFDLTDYNRGIYILVITITDINGSRISSEKISKR